MTTRMMSYCDVNDQRKSYMKYFILSKQGEIRSLQEHIRHLYSKTVVNMSGEFRGTVTDFYLWNSNIIFKICYFLHKIITFTFTGKFIKFGNFTCLTKQTVKRLIEEKATWSSFSGSLAKTENNLILATNGTKVG